MINTNTNVQPVDICNTINTSDADSHMSLREMLIRENEHRKALKALRGRIVEEVSHINIAADIHTENIQGSSITYIQMGLWNENTTPQEQANLISSALEYKFTPGDFMFELDRMIKTQCCMSCSLNPQTVEVLKKYV